MILPPLPLIDNHLFIDATAFEKYTTCRRSFQYYALAKRESAAKKAALEAGAVFHSIMEVRRTLEGTAPLNRIQSVQEDMAELLFTGFAAMPQPKCPGLTSPSLADYLTIKHGKPTHHDLCTLYPGYQPALDDFRTHSHMITVLRKYNETYPVEPFRALCGVEVPFAEPLVTLHYPAIQPEPITIYWTGRLDFPSLWPGDEIWNIDLKTSTMESGFEEYYNNQAQIGYLWWLWKRFGRFPTGFMIDLVLWRAPSAKGKGIEFRRHRQRIEPERIIEWEANTIHLFEDILHDYARGHYPMESAWCKGKYGCCPYLDVCQLKPSARDLLLASNFYKDVTWSPLRVATNEQKEQK